MKTEKLKQGINYSTSKKNYTKSKMYEFDFSTKMWEQLAADVSIIRSCYKYLRHKQPQFIRKRCYQKFPANVKEAEKACGCIRDIVERKGTMEMDGFRRKLQVWEKELTF